MPDLFATRTPEAVMKVLALQPAPHDQALLPADPVLRRRAIRVLTLTFAVMLLSFGDLYMTLTHLKAAGMAEGNPIARYVIGFNSPELLAAWKTCSIGLACLVFIAARTRRTAEIACWFCTVVLLCLTCRWLAYSAELDTLTPTLSAISQSDGSGWVSLDDTAP
jgi:hypothetical protein